MRSKLTLLAVALTSLATFVACGDSTIDAEGDSTPANEVDPTGPSQSTTPTTPGTPGTSTPVTPGTTNGTCGAGKTSTCPDGLPCGTAADCSSGVCSGAVCQVPSDKDGVKNGDETDTDCGGATAKKCDVGQVCKTYADCKDDCDPGSSRCVVGKSCWKHGGGQYTCGATEAASGNCCERATIAGSTVKLDKFQVTAGRMRGMIERLGGDVRSFTSTLPASLWDQSWQKLVPSNVTEADEILGPFFTSATNRTAGAGGWSKVSCQVEDATGHTYWTPFDGKKGEYSSYFTQEQLDPKALNCVGWHIAQAFCAYEGGRLPTGTEIVQALTNNATTPYPWGGVVGSFPFGKGDENSKQDPHGNHAMNYSYPQLPASGYTRAGNPKDASVYMAPPGRFPLGNNAAGMADLLGDMIPWVWETKNGKPIETGFVWTDSWENHTEWWDEEPNPPRMGKLHVSSWQKDQNPNQPNGYYAIGFRCAYDQ